MPTEQKEEALEKIASQLNLISWFLGLIVVLFSVRSCATTISRKVSSPGIEHRLERIEQAILDGAHGQVKPLPQQRHMTTRKMNDD